MTWWQGLEFLSKAPSWDRGRNLPPNLEDRDKAVTHLPEILSSEVETAKEELGALGCG